MIYGIETAQPFMLADSLKRAESDFNIWLSSLKYPLGNYNGLRVTTSGPRRLKDSNGIAIDKPGGVHYDGYAIDLSVDPERKTALPYLYLFFAFVYFNRMKYDIKCGLLAYENRHIHFDIHPSRKDFIYGSEKYEGNGKFQVTRINEIELKSLASHYNIPEKYINYLVTAQNFIMSTGAIFLLTFSSVFFYIIFKKFNVV